MKNYFQVPILTNIKNVHDFFLETSGICLRLVILSEFFYMHHKQLTFMGTVPPHISFYHLELCEVDWRIIMPLAEENAFQSTDFTYWFHPSEY
jgi:hypothetical protein